MSTDFVVDNDPVNEWGNVIDPTNTSNTDTASGLPAITGAADTLLAQYRDELRRVEMVAAYMAESEHNGVLGLFLEGNGPRDGSDRGWSGLASTTARLFARDGAVAALNARYWSRALALTDVLDLMPQQRRNEWNHQIRTLSCPDFEPQTLRATLTQLMSMRAQFLGERVDGIFRGLSGEHVTNSPEAFGKRMIIARVLDSLGYPDSSTCGLINDLRCVVARFMGRDEPRYEATRQLVPALKDRWGQWMEVDGGALRMRLYRKGTAHLEVHPDMAWRLNATLASLYPTAIPAQFRRRPTRSARSVPLMQRPLPFGVLDILARLEPARVPSEDRRSGWADIPGCYSLRSIGVTAVDRQSMREAELVLECLGATRTDRHETWRFEFNPLPAIQEIVVSGRIPDSVAHQFYPTPPELARQCVEQALIGPRSRILEPSAGNGALAGLMPADRTTCVEISSVRCAILQARGYAMTHQADFLEWSTRQAPGRFDRIVMNPPFSDGRAVAHLQSAARLLAAAGILVSILPASLRGRAEILQAFPRLQLSWSAVIDNAFAGTGVSVVILTARDVDAAPDVEP